MKTLAADTQQLFLFENVLLKYGIINVAGAFRNKDIDGGGSPAKNGPTDRTDWKRIS